MADFLSPTERSERMARVRGRDTKPELFVRKALHAEGFRFRVNVANLPGRPDIVMRRYSTAIFVHGCYWHSHSCQKGRIPSTNPAFWEKKFLTNKRRDVRVAQALRGQGWHVYVVWECQLRTIAGRERTIKALAKRIRRNQRDGA
nr:very short patch repair endonuclease [Stenotrophomonas daejeonensis]